MSAPTVTTTAVKASHRSHSPQTKHRAVAKSDKSDKSKKAGKKRPAASQEEQLYSLPAELLAQELEPEPQGDPWPARALIFKVWDSKVNGDRDEMLCDVLRERGWIDGGGFCDPNMMEELPVILAGKHPTALLPRRALWVPGDAREAKELLGAFGTNAATAKRFRVSALPGASRPVT